MSSNEPRRSPYQGLTPFDERDAPYFFGRDKDARLIAADLFAAPLSVLYGASGVGKSSVLRAGVVPQLRPAEDLLVIVFSTWQSEPTTALKGAVVEAVFASAAIGTKESVRYHEEVSRHEYDPLAKFLPLCSKLVGRRLMIILDQFEEYSLYHPEGGMFFEQFPPATGIGDLSVSFLISLREDALARLDRFEGKIPGLFDNLRRIDHLDAAAARDAIRKPLEKYAEDHPDEPRIAVEDELVDAVVEDVRANRIGFEGTGRGTEIPSSITASDRIEAPYLQLVMTRLWDDARTRDAGVLQVERFYSLGKAKNIVDDHLDTVLRRLTDDQRDAAARVFEFLVTPSGTKIAHTVRDLSLSLGIDATLLRTMMERLSAGTDRVLRPVAALPETPNEPRYEIFHDRLAPAILAWRSEYVRKRQVAAASLSEIETRAAQPFEVRRGGEPKSHGPVVDAPPYELWADLLHEGTLTVVLGSGASASGRPAGATWQPHGILAPTGWELTQYLAHETGFPATELGAGSLGEVASYYAAVAGQHVLRERLHTLFSTPSQPALIHEAIAHAADRKPLLILTSTFDTLMEQALDARNIAYGVIANDVQRGEAQVIWYSPDQPMRRGPAKEVRPLPEFTWIYKLFGSASPKGPDESTFVITEEDEMNLFVAFNGAQYPPRALASRMTRNRALFLGMGLRSWTQRLLIAALKSKGGWAVARGVSIVDARRWQQASIEVYDRDLSDVAAKLGALL